MFWRIFYILLVATNFTVSLAPSNILILILSQQNDYNIQLAYNLRFDLLNQSLLFSRENLINVYLTHEVFSHIGDWTILYLLPSLMKTNIINENIKWILFCEDQSKINLKNLIKGLSTVDYTKEIYLGHALHDQEATIIHHFAFYENPKWFPYPLLRAGVAFSKPLLNTLGNLITEKTRLPRTEFFIDASHELSFFIWQNIKIENNKWKISSLTIKENKLKNSIKTVNEDSITDDNHYSTSDKIKINTESNLKYNSIPMNTNSKTQHIVIDKDSKNRYLDNKKKTIFAEYNEHPNVQNKRNDVKDTVAQYDKMNGIGTNSKNWNNNRVNDSTNSNSSNHNKNKENVKTKEVDNVKKKLLLVNASSYFCTKEDSNCAVYPNIIQGNSSLCMAITPQKIYFAIKTCHKFHKERIPIIEATWGPHAPVKRYFSDMQDLFIPTIITGIPNTDSGHCAKALKIIKIAVNEIDIMNKKNKIKIDWIVLSDDDTLLSISAICDILGCYKSVKYVYLGERYGYRIHAKDGFNYITGGGGIVFNIPTARIIIEYCTCPQDSSPDDMIIGTCLKNLGIIPIHSSKFHQARPIDYPTEILKIETPVSFHKFWQIDPVDVYNTFLYGNLSRTLPIIYKYKQKKENLFKTLDSNFSKNCDNILDCNKISIKINKLQSSKIKDENLEHRRKLQAFSKSTTLLPKTKLFQHIDL
ncbi:beta-1,3-glucosyltransferase [Condylostylus longicornis]|uniref:beta-1,3-glucosyltransferase n=1 Tax=Condylostylus longicornis TaxID=2530218 RepID=UPI00244DE3D8|nr:beta-1,3-glucosyltransferase [Condylostylus longicornis]